MITILFEFYYFNNQQKKVKKIHRNCEQLSRLVGQNLERCLIFFSPKHKVEIIILNYIFPRVKWL